MSPSWAGFSVCEIAAPSFSGCPTAAGVAVHLQEELDQGPEACVAKGKRMVKMKSGPHFVKEQEGLADMLELIDVAARDGDETGTKVIDDESTFGDSLQTNT